MAGGYLWGTTMAWWLFGLLLQLFQKWNSKRQLQYKPHIPTTIITATTAAAIVLLQVSKGSAAGGGG